MTRGVAGAVAGILAALVAAAVAEPSEAGTSRVPDGSGRIEEFLGCEGPDGERVMVRIAQDDMPWRVSIGMPPQAPRYGSRPQAREAAIDAMREWERAIRASLPWFALEFAAADDDGAAVRIRWKRRITGTAAGRAGPTCVRVGGRVRPGGRMEVAVRSCPTCRPLTVDEIRMLFAHEFGHVLGHVLGLGHCLDCDSAMNYSWETRERVFVTRTDVIAVLERHRGREVAEEPEDDAGRSEE